MIAAIDLRTIRKRSSNHAVLRASLQQLVGQPFLRVRFSYGDEITLHFGLPQPYRSPKLASLTKGSYVIGARASAWFVITQSPPRVIFGTEQPMARNGKDLKLLTPAVLEESECLSLGARIVAIDAVTLGTRRLAYGYGLSVLLEDGSSILIEPPPPVKSNGRSPQVADWELFTPHERYFRVGPGLRWSYLPSRRTGRAAK